MAKRDAYTSDKTHCIAVKMNDNLLEKMRGDIKKWKFKNQSSYIRFLLENADSVVLRF